MTYKAKTLAKFALLTLRSLILTLLLMPLLTSQPILITLPTEEQLLQQQYLRWQNAFILGLIASILTLIGKQLMQLKYSHFVLSVLSIGLIYHALKLLRTGAGFSMYAIDELVVFYLATALLIVLNYGMYLMQRSRQKI